MKKRVSGVLMHISSLPSNYGIGTFGKEAYDFIDFLHRTKQKYWQILPLTTTSYGDSPYQSFSAIAGNTNFIDLDLLVEDKLITIEEILEIDFYEKEDIVNYEKVFYGRRKLFKKIANNFKQKIDGYEKKEYEKFLLENEKWLNDFSLFMAIKDYFDLKSFYYWDEDIRNRKKEAVEKYSKKLFKEIEEYKILQYLFFKQWNNLKKYANSKNIEIIGDMPIYIAEDSVEMWTKSELFETKNNKPTLVAGCPPDSFSDDGQLWGNPIYNWKKMEEEKFEWWVYRIEEAFKIYDVVRIDHFKGFSDFWAIPYGEKTAKNGKWIEGPRLKLFNRIKEKLGDLNIIAEDLGYMDENSIYLRDTTGFPGMKILQFAFYDDDSQELPHYYINNSVAYTGTHDNDVINSWYETLNDKQKERVHKYLNIRNDEKITRAMLRGIYSSVAFLSVATMQDLLDKNGESRMNFPGKIGNNWIWRMKKDELTNEVEKLLYDLTKTYNREN